MIEITPIGIIAGDVAISTNFYRQVLGIKTIRRMGNMEGMPVLRLESPAIEIDSTMIATFDRHTNNYQTHTQRLRLICSLEQTVTALKQAGIDVNEENGRYHFIDMNGLTWHLSDNLSRHLNS